MDNDTDSCTNYLLNNCITKAVQLNLCLLEYDRQKIGEKLSEAQQNLAEWQGCLMRARKDQRWNKVAMVQLEVNAWLDEHRFYLSLLKSKSAQLQEIEEELSLLQQ